eukprot:119712_1
MTLINNNANFAIDDLDKCRPHGTENLTQTAVYTPRSMDTTNVISDVILVVYTAQSVKIRTSKQCFSFLIDRINSCKAIYHEFNNFNLKDAKLSDIKEGLKLFYQPLVYDMDHYSFMCNNCGEAEIVKVETDIVKSPRVLILTLDRTLFTDTVASKIEHLVHYPINQLHLTKTDSYDLFAVCSHYGSSTSSGHYVAYVKGIGTNQWYYTSDMTVRETNIESVVNAAALVLMYELNE